MEAFCMDAPGISRSFVPLHTPVISASKKDSSATSMVGKKFFGKPKPALAPSLRDSEVKPLFLRENVLKKVITPIVGFIKKTVGISRTTTELARAVESARSTALIKPSMKTSTKIAQVASKALPKHKAKAPSLKERASQKPAGKIYNSRKVI